MTRAAWGARPFEGTPVPQPRYDDLVLHHAAGFGAETLEEGIARVRQIQRLHQEERAWSDIGYHFVVDRGGRLYQGRPYAQPLPLSRQPDLVVGAHVGGHNTGRIGVCILGCYHPEATDRPCGDVPTDRSLEAVVRLLAFLCRAYAIPTDHIRGHRAFNETVCPGSRLEERLPEIRRRVEKMLTRAGGV